MKARTIDPWKSKIENQINCFYQKYNYTKTNQIKFEIVDDIYKRRLELIKNSKKEIEITNQNKDFLKNYNGHVVLGYTPGDNITVLFNRKNLSQDECSWLGTIHHEYTHAHDFLELLPTLCLNTCDQIYQYEFYDEYIFWSEFHSRISGSTNTYMNIYKDNISSNDDSICQKLFEENCIKLVNAESFYNDIAQCLGRHKALKNLYGTRTPSLQSACKKFGLSQELVDLYNYLDSHCSFEKIDFNTLRNLLMCIHLER